MPQNPRIVSPPFPESDTCPSPDRSPEQQEDDSALATCLMASVMEVGTEEALKPTLDSAAAKRVPKVFSVLRLHVGRRWPACVPVAPSWPGGTAAAKPSGRCGSSGNRRRSKGHAQFHEVVHHGGVAGGVAQQHAQGPQRLRGRVRRKGCSNAVNAPATRRRSAAELGRLGQDVGPWRIAGLERGGRMRNTRMGSRRGCLGQR